MKNIYCIKDNKAEAFVANVDVQGLDAVAIRTFGDIASDQRTGIYAHVEDYDLYCLGSFDEQQGIVSHKKDIYNHSLQDEEQYNGIKPRLVITGKQWRDMQPMARDITPITGGN